MMTDCRSLALFAALLLGACAGDSQRTVGGDLSAPGDGKGLNLRDGIIVPLLDGPRADRSDPLPDGANPDSVVDSGAPAPDTRPAPRDMERTLAYTGTGGTEWLHLFARAAGATSISVRTAHLSENLVPPYATVFTPRIDSGQCTSANLSGTLLANASPFTTTITYCFSNDQVQVSHVSSVSGQPPGAGQTHGTASVDPYDTTLPYERSLLFVGAGGTEWLHVARRAAGAANVDVETFSYSAALVPAARHHTLLGITPGGCKSQTLSGTFVSDGAAFSTRVQYCRVLDRLEIEHASSSGGTTNPPTAHGSIAIE